MVKIHSANWSPFSKESFQLVGSTWFLSLGDDQEYFQPYPLDECCFFIFYLLCQECSTLLNPSELLQKLTSLLTVPCSSCSRTWNEMLHLVDDLSSCFPFPTETNIYIFFHIFCIAVWFPVLSLQWNSPEWCSCCSRRGTGFVLLKCIYWSLLLHSPYWDAVNLWCSEVFWLPSTCDYILWK